MKLVLVILVTLSTICATVNCYFHCSRTLMECQNGGTCDHDTGNCICTSAYTSQNCGVDISTLCPTPAEDPTFVNPCQNNGICHSGGQCACSLDFYGPNCTLATVDSKCTGAEFSLEIAVPEAFDGAIYLQSNDSCAFSVVDPKAAGFINFQYNMSLKKEDLDACNNAINTTETGRDITYTTDAIVNFVPFLFVNTDLSVNFKCTHRASDVEMGSMLGAVNINEKKHLQKEEKAKVYAPVRFRFLDENNQKVQQLSVGDKFKLTFYLDSDAVYTSLILVNCSANNTIANKPLVFKFLEQGCPTRPGENVIVHKHGQENGTYTSEQQTTHTSVELLMKAFKFVNSDRVAFGCSVRICKRGEESNCKIPNCQAGERLEPVSTVPDVAESPAPADGTAAGDAGTDNAPAAADTSAGEGGADTTGGEPSKADATADAGTADTGTADAGTADAGTADTSAAAADAGETPPVRRKRSVFETEETTISGVIEVFDPIQTEPRKSDKGSSEKECFRSRDILIVIVVMSAFVLTLLIACIVLAITVSRTRSRVNSMISDSSHGPSFFIPRAKVLA